MIEKFKELCNKVNWDYKECIINFENNLGGTNMSYICEYKLTQKKYVIRFGVKSGDILAINRKAEYEAIKAMSSSGYSPKFVYFDILDGNMITEYINGSNVNENDVKDDEFFIRMLKLLKNMHQIKTVEKFNPYNDIEKKLYYIKEYNIPLNKRFNEAYDKYKTIRDRNKLENSPHLGLCHNDPFYSNFFLDDDGKIYLLDFEFSGMGDIFYDLACLFGGLGYDKKVLFLKEYFGYFNDTLMNKLNDFTYIQVLWNGTWAYLKSIEPSVKNFDYINFGHKHIDMLFNIPVIL